MAILAVFEVVNMKGEGTLVKVPVVDGNVPDLNLFLQEHYHKKNKKYKTACKSSPFLVEEQGEHEFFIKFVADDSYTHLYKASHATKTEPDLDKDWVLAVHKAKKKGFDWNHGDACLNMKDRGWTLQPLNTVQLDY